MSYGETQLTMPVAPTGNGGYGGNGGLLGGEGLLGVLFLVGMLGGWNGSGGLFGGGNNGAGAEVQRGFDHSATITKLDGITTGLADLGYAINNTMNNGFHSVDRGLCDLGARLADCCCTTQRAIDQVNYNLATQSCDTRNLIQSSTRDILEALNQNYTRSLETRVNDMTMAAYFADLKAYNRATAEANTAEILNRAAPIPRPSYNVPNPYTGQYGYGFNNGYGCPCGC